MEYQLEFDLLGYLHDLVLEHRNGQLTDAAFILNVVVTTSKMNEIKRLQSGIDEFTHRIESFQERINELNTELIELV